MVIYCDITIVIRSIVGGYYHQYSAYQITVLCDNQAENNLIASNLDLEFYADKLSFLLRQDEQFEEAAGVCGFHDACIFQG